MRVEKVAEQEVPPQTTLHFEPPPSISIPEYCFSLLQVLHILCREVDQGPGQLLPFSLSPFFSLQICEFVQKDELKPAVTQLLWERATEKVPCSPLERCSSVMLLGMMSR